jgi:hypothetical protein
MVKAMAAAASQHEGCGYQLSVLRYLDPTLSKCSFFQQICITFGLLQHA